MNKEELRHHVEVHLGEIVVQINHALKAKNLKALEPVLTRIGRGQQLPHWYEQLRREGTLPNLDGKTVGSVVEMLLVAILEASTFKGKGLPPFSINPARGIDLPDLDLGVKSPSENYCTSEPFFSAYERLLGSHHDVLVLLTNYQDVKGRPPLKLQIKSARYLRASQIADESLCRIAKKRRDRLVAEDAGRAKRFVRFLAYVNQSDWRAKRILSLLDNLNDEETITKNIQEARYDFDRKNRELMKKGKIPLQDSDIEALEGIAKLSPLSYGVIDAADNWLAEICGETARAPSDAEWNAILKSPLDGMIGMSLALQWRYNFGRLFGIKSVKGSR